MRFSQLIAGETVHVDDGFVKHLFEIIEELSDDVNDPYHYPVIRVLVRRFTRTLRVDSYRQTNLLRS